MRYTSARYRQHQRDMVYRVYVTDCLRMMTENTAKFSGGRYVTRIFSEVLRREPVDNRTGEEIAADVIKNAGLVVKE